MWSIYKVVKHLFFEQYKSKRIKKIESIFGRNWFAGKSILDVGTAHGDMGIHFLKRGSLVLFSDVREEHLQDVRNTLAPMSIVPDTIKLDTNHYYDLKRRFDLILHLGVLQNVPNWKQDLECAMSHTNNMILDCMVVPQEGYETHTSVSDDKFVNKPEFPYAGVHAEMPSFTQEAVEKHLTSIGCKYLRLDDEELNTDWALTRKGDNIMHGDLYTRIVYDWVYGQDYVVHGSDTIRYNLCFQRMWLVLK